MTTDQGQRFEVEGTDISYHIDEDGFRVEILGRGYTVKYPLAIYRTLDQKAKRVLAENFIYCRTKSLSLQTDEVLPYRLSRPINKELVSYGIVGDIPRLAYLSNVSIAELLDMYRDNEEKEIFKQTDLTNGTIAVTTENDKAILALSFGKDSLLSYGLAQELGLSFRLVYVKEMEELNSAEEKFKNAIIADFTAEENVSIDFLTDNIDEIFFDLKFARKVEDLENTNGMLAFALELAPFACYYRAKYLLFGNEANFSDYYPDGSYKIYPSFDQSILYAKEENRLFDCLTSGKIQIASLVEPIYNIVEMALLVNRYPKLLKYMMSCSPKETDPDKWCYGCPMCAKAFLYLVAVGGRAEQIGFNRDFFKQEYKDLYPLFNKNVKRVYEKPTAVRDEQLLSFLFAYRRGARGALIDLFKEEYLVEAEKREPELREKFLTIHETATIPEFIKEKLIHIYQEEIKKL
ncbi:MAG: hypothetical protein HUU49_02645 [Candidatus Buchananbacteria bacterium]|nr:hypothetical protein [Candidatus Buchananbacteria bacterium]